MNIEERKNYVKELMGDYKRESEEFLELANEIYKAEFNFVNYMKEKVSPSSYERALNEFDAESKKVNEIIASKKASLDNLLNEFSKTNNNYSADILTKVRRNKLSKEEVANTMKELTNDFDNNYSSLINDYTVDFKNLISKIEKIVKTNRKFVVEYGDFQLTDQPTVNEYKPIYDKHDVVYDKFIFEFQAEALRINFLTEQIKNTYTRITKMLDENYDIFSELTEILDK